LGQQAATYHWAGASGQTGGNLPLNRGSGNRRQPTTGQGPRGLNGTLAVETGHSTAPIQLSRVIGFTGTQRGSDGSSTQGHHRTRVVSAHTAETVQDTSGRCIHRGQFRTRVVDAHSRHSSGHGWSVHIAGTVQNTGGRCAQQAQFRTQVVSAHNRDSSGHGGRCTQQAQFRTQVVSAHNRDSSEHRWSVRTGGTVQD
ncbi:unnamed protein product, partial [Staurois parvus]